MGQIKLIAIGLVLGITTVIPGLSSGTMAIVFNVYERLINIISPNIKKFFAAWKFWLFLGIGIITGIIFFSKAIIILYEKHPVPTIWFFIGLIVGSIPLIYRRIAPSFSVLPSFSTTICFVLALAIMIMMNIFRPDEGSILYTALTPQIFGMMLLAGIFSAIAMIIPGISGAFLLLVTGLYRTVLQVVADLNIPLLIPFLFGAGIGVLLGAALVRSLLSKFPRQTYGAVLGLVGGSIIVLYPGGFGEGIAIIFSVMSLLAGNAISFVAGRQNISASFN